MRLLLDEPRPLRSLAVTFVAPLQTGAPARFEAEVLRQGRAVTQVLGRAVQDGQVTALVQGSFGLARASSVEVTPAPAPTMPAVEDCRELPYIKGVTPEFTRHLAMSWGEGGLPFSNTPARGMGGWVRLRESSDAILDESHLLALVDAWPPAPLMHLRAPAPGSTLTWTIEFVQPRPAGLRADDSYLYRAEIECAHDGYGHVAAGLWSREGALLAISRQTVTVFA